MSADFAGIFTGVYIIVYAITMIASIAFYVLQSIGFYTMAKRRGIENPWLAWIPVGEAYIMGALADDYNIKARNTKTKYRHILLYLSIGAMALLVMLMPILIVGILGTVESDISTLAIGPMILLLLIYLAIIGIAIAASVFRYISIYRIFQSCSPKNTLVYFLLTIFISGVYPFFVFFLRNSDEGMPQIIQGEN